MQCNTATNSQKNKIMTFSCILHQDKHPCYNHQRRLCPKCCHFIKKLDIKTIKSFRDSLQHLIGPHVNSRVCRLIARMCWNYIQSADKDFKLQAYWKIVATAPTAIAYYNLRAITRRKKFSYFIFKLIYNFK